MALIRCLECGKEVSDRAPSCPNCGNAFGAAAHGPAAATSRKDSHPFLPFIVGAAVVAIALTVMGFASGEAGSEAVTAEPPSARFITTDLLMDEHCTELGEYCVNVRCTFQNVGHTAGAFTVRAILSDKETSSVLANHYTSLTLMPAATQRVTFSFPEATIDAESAGVCKVDPAVPDGRES